MLEHAQCIQCTQTRTELCKVFLGKRCNNGLMYIGPCIIFIVE